VLRGFSVITIFFALNALFCTSAIAASKPWTTLTPMQQEALAPIAQQWSTLPETQQTRLLATTKRYPQLSPQQKQLFLARLTDWSKLTQEQRNRAREKYKAFRKVEPAKREEVKKMVRQSEAEKTSATAASGVVAAPVK
jgi:Protein of unknown function (DUF3106)